MLKEKANKEGVSVDNITAIHFRYDSNGRLRRYSRKNKKANTFKPETKGGMTVVAVTVSFKGESDVIMGVSYCNKVDNFWYKEGRVLAVRDALSKLGISDYWAADLWDEKIFNA